MFCKNCGKQIDDNLAQCPYCNTILTENTIIDSGSTWWGVLGCCIPIVGLVLYIVWKDVKPKNCKKAGIGALIGFIFYVSLPILFYLFVFLFAINYGY